MKGSGAPEPQTDAIDFDNGTLGPAAAGEEARSSVAEAEGLKGVSQLEGPVSATSVTIPKKLAAETNP
jgi:hypothetical protein